MALLVRGRGEEIWVKESRLFVMTKFWRPNVTVANYLQERGEPKHTHHLHTQKENGTCVRCPAWTVTAVSHCMCAHAHTQTSCSTLQMCIIANFQLYLSSTVGRERKRVWGDKIQETWAAPCERHSATQALGCVLSCGLARTYVEGFSAPTGAGKFCLWRGTRPSGEE